MHVFAYIDPGAGSLVIQALIAAVISVPIVFRNTVKRTLGRFRRSDQRTTITSHRPTDSPRG